MAQDYYSRRDRSLGITWEKLHQDLCKNPRLCSAPPGQQEFMEKMFMRPSASPDGRPEKGALYLAAFAPKGDPGSHSVRKYIGYLYYGNDQSYSRYVNVRNYLIRQKNPAGESWDYRTHPDLLAFQAVWEELIPASASAGYSGDLEDAIGGILNDIPLGIAANDLMIYERLSALLDGHEYSLALAVLSVIASTLFCFGCGEEPFSEEDLALHALALPPLPRQEESSELKKARAFAAGKTGTLEELHQLLKLPLTNKAERGDACFLLAKYAYERSREEEPDSRRRRELTRTFNEYLKKAMQYGSRKAIQLDHERKAAELLGRARSIFNGAAQSDLSAVRECCAGCLRILQFSPAVDANFRGEASYILYKYTKLGLFVSPSGETSQDYLDLSHRLGYPLARDDWAASNTFSIEPQFERASSRTRGVCYANAENIVSETFARTVPESWQTYQGPISKFDIAAIAEKLYDPVHFRFLLIDDDPRVNRKDFFALMQLIRESSLESAENMEVFLRHDYETAKPLVDTALSHLSGCRIAVYILDDDKQAAQQLLSCHPLFYPVRSVNFNLPAGRARQADPASKIERPVLNFIILGSTRVAEWLVREAFWMMGFKENLIENRITILSDDGEAFEAGIKSRYPGMAKGNLEIEDMEFPVIKGISVREDSPALYREIEALLEMTRYNYFAVATESDEKNLSLAMRLREFLIRQHIKNRRSHDLLVSPPIAFLCRDDRLSWISRELVVEEETEGDRWFNTWNLIPFGEISSRYSFDHITGGTFEELARCIHYQYSAVSPEDARKHTKAWETATREYYLRQYNQDSSYSSAISMPYRIFQFQDREGSQVIPAAWSICQTTVFSSVNQLRALSRRLWSFVNETRRAEQEQAVARWEHARWVKWMISRGWRPATIEETVFAIENGNPRQQLFVAKLHPCICSYEELKTLQDALLARCNMKKDFFTSDLSNIRATPGLLALEWIPSASRESEKD